MISEAVKLVLSLEQTGIHTGKSIIHACEIMRWPVNNSQEVFVMDCDYDGNPLADGILKVFTDWNIGLKIRKEMNCSEDYLLSKEGRNQLLNYLLL